jgi:hypothetical protein
MFISLLTGVWVGAVMTDGRAIFMELHFTPSAQRLALIAHMNAMLGCFWLAALAFTIEMTSFDEKKKKLLGLAITVICYANWGVTLVGSFMDKKGLEMVKDDPKNNVMAIFLIVLVVVPALAASAAWAFGLRSGTTGGTKASA